MADIIIATLYVVCQLTMERTETDAAFYKQVTFGIAPNCEICSWKLAELHQNHYYFFCLCQWPESGFMINPVFSCISMQLSNTRCKQYSCPICLFIAAKNYAVIEDYIGIIYWLPAILALKQNDLQRLNLPNNILTIRYFHVLLKNAAVLRPGNEFFVATNHLQMKSDTSYQN